MVDCDKLCPTYRGVEQWLARWAHNPKAGGSNPSPAIFIPLTMAV